KTPHTHTRLTEAQSRARAGAAMASSSFKVTRISEGAVKPASETPDHTLPLAWVDRYPTHRGLVESMHIFRSGADAAPAVIREALGKALAFFYPLAGRIVEQPEKGCPAIRCTADGVYFAEAVAECSLEDVRFLERPLLLPKEDLVPYPADDLWGVEPHNTIFMVPDHEVHLRRVRDGPAVQPRVGGRHGRGAVHQGGGRHGAGAPGAGGEAGVGQGEVPQPEHQAGPAPGAPRAGAGLHRARLPHGLHRRAQDAVQGAQRQVLLRLRRADGQALAVPHPGAEPGAGRHGEALLLRQRAPPAEAGRGVLRQLHLPREDVRDEQGGAEVVGDGGYRHDPGGEAADGGGVLPVRQGGDAAGPLPDELRLRVHLRLRLEQAGVLRRGLRLRPAHVRRPARQQRLHRLRRHPQGAAAAGRHPDARQLRHQGALGGVRPRHEGGPAMSELLRFALLDDRENLGMHA
uniref:Uncharacterized protein n=1 Tax=Aegilops tauschii subsp. strangulata TaxID=200361 RepID=A0A453E7E6_AEGTS